MPIIRSAVAAGLLLWCSSTVHAAPLPDHEFLKRADVVSTLSYSAGQVMVIPEESLTIPTTAIRNFFGQDYTFTGPVVVPAATTTFAEAMATTVTMAQ